MAKEADMDVSDEELDVDEPQKQQRGGKKLQSLKSKLQQSLSEPLSARGVSFKYITSGSLDFVQNILDDERECEACLGGQVQ